MSEEDRELQEKIARLKSRISHHKAADRISKASRYNHFYQSPQYGGRLNQTHGGRSDHKPSFRNRTLVVNNASPTARADNEAVESSAWILKRDRHMQLINSSVYEQKTQERSKAIAETQQKRMSVKEKLEKEALQRHIDVASTVATTSKGEAQRYIQVQNVKFLVADGGSKLIRSKDAYNEDKPQTPRRVVLNGVTFMRSQHGNLYRSGFIKTKRKVATKKSTDLCPVFCNSGTCAKGPLCKYTHDPTKVAICKDLLTTGQCPAGKSCDMSHEFTPERVPACVHFQRGHCTKEDCRYSHVRTSSGSPVCREFATYGYCPQGSSCDQRHIRECPDYANKGVCHNKRCRLPHVDRAGQLRKAAGTATSEQQDMSCAEDEAPSDISSAGEDDDVGDSDDVDSDEFEEPLIIEEDEHQLKGQDDFVRL